MGGSSSRVVAFSDYQDLGYWRGPYGILVSNGISAVLSEDQCNYVIRPGDLRTNAYTSNTPLDKDAYMKKYGQTHFNNYYFNADGDVSNELTDHRVHTVNKRGKEKHYTRMNNGEIFRETSRGVKTIKPVTYKIKSW